MFVSLVLLVTVTHAAVCDPDRMCRPLQAVSCDTEAAPDQPNSCALIKPWTVGEVPDDKVRYRFVCATKLDYGTRNHYCKVGEPKPVAAHAAQLSREFAQGKAPTDYSTLAPPPPTMDVDAARCENETACSSRETYQTCEKAPCAVNADPSVLARKVCERGDFTAWCVKTPDENPASTGCLCGHGSPAEGGLGVLLLLLVARIRRKHG